MTHYVIRKWVAGEMHPSEPIRTMWETFSFGKKEAFDEFREMANDLLEAGYKIVYITHQWNYTFKKGKEEFQLYMYENR